MTPISLQLDADCLRVEWPDAVHSIPATTLRTTCRCAECQYLERAGTLPTVAPGVTLCDATPVGNYGLQLHFSDGHRRGIYPWVHLRALAEQMKASVGVQASIEQVTT